MKGATYEVKVLAINYIGKDEENFSPLIEVVAMDRISAPTNVKTSFDEKMTKLSVTWTTPKMQTSVTNLEY